VGRKCVGDAIKGKVWCPPADASTKLFIQHCVDTRANRLK
jgi:hypothetical protein